jgi:hypothetical protein
VPRPRLERIIREKNGISADTALRLGAYFHTTPEFWLNLQIKFELETARRAENVRAENVRSVLKVTHCLYHFLGAVWLWNEQAPRRDFFAYGRTVARYDDDVYCRPATPH